MLELTLSSDWGGKVNPMLELTLSSDWGDKVNPMLELTLSSDWGGKVNPMLELTLSSSDGSMNSATGITVRCKLYWPFGALFIKFQLRPEQVWPDADIL